VPSGTTVLDNVAGASSPQGGEVAVAGASGHLTIESAGATLALSAGTAAVGAMVDVVASLAPSGAQLAAVAADIRFDSTRLEVVEKDGAPDCTVDESIGDASQFRKEIFAAIGDSEEEDVAILRVGIASRENNEVLPDIGEALPVFRCRFQVGIESGPIVLDPSASASDPSGQEAGLSGIPGTLTVE